MHLISAIPTEALSGDLLWAIAAFLVGFILWAAGGWILRPAVGALGLGLGALGGLLIWMETGIGPPWAAPLVGGILVACVALLAYRLLAGGMLAATLALLAATSSWSVLHLTEDGVPPPPVATLFGLPLQPPPPADQGEHSRHRTPPCSHPSVDDFPARPGRQADSPAMSGLFRSRMHGNNCLPIHAWRCCSSPVQRHLVDSSARRSLEPWAPSC